MNIPGVGGLADQFLALIKNFAPHSWVGNIEPGGPHFTSIDKMDTGINISVQHIWVSTVFTADGVQHKLQMSQPISHFGQSGTTTNLEFDHVVQDGAGFVVSERVGLFGVHLVATYKFTVAGKEVRYRFDGAI